VGNKLDDLLEVRRDLSLGVMFLVETWHDTESVAFRRLRADGFQVVDRPRPRSDTDTSGWNSIEQSLGLSHGSRLKKHRCYAVDWI